MLKEIRLENFLKRKQCGTNLEINAELRLGDECCKKLMFFIAKELDQSNFFLIYNAFDSKNILYKTENYYDAINYFYILIDKYKKMINEKFLNKTHLSSCEIIMKLAKNG